MLVQKGVVHCKMPAALTVLCFGQSMRCVVNIARIDLNPKNRLPYGTQGNCKGADAGIIQFIQHKPTPRRRNVL